MRVRVTAIAEGSQTVVAPGQPSPGPTFLVSFIRVAVSPENAPLGTFQLHLADLGELLGGSGELQVSGEYNLAATPAE